MAEIKFNFEGINTSIQCDTKDKFKDIIKKFYTKINKEGDANLYYLYNGTKINENLTFIEQANQLDKNRNKMDVIVYNNFEEHHESKEIISREIICPKCKENCSIDIKDFKVNFINCKNNHINNNILLNNYELTQKIDLKEIICEICKNNNKGDTHNNEFYICNNCNKNICPLCKSIHDKNHNIINFNDKNYICKKHNDIFNKFCKSCNENICIFCEEEHKNHDIIDLSSIIIKKDEFSKILKELKQSIDNYKYQINAIKQIFDKMINIIDAYYKINNDIINNYNMNKRNYYNLLTLQNLKNNNELLIKEINNAINSNIISEIYNYAFNNFYNENGEKYIGEIKNGLKEGQGILYFDKNNIRKKYEGEFINDKIEGKGIMYFNNGDIFEGEFKNDKKEGKGLMNYNNGDKYDGEFKNDVKEGKGIMSYKNGDKYEGDFKNDVKEGKGLFVWNDGEIYEGDWKNDTPEGNGIYYYRNDDRYEGEFKNGIKEGKGIMYYNDGKIENGNWKNDEFVNEATPP